MKHIKKTFLIFSVLTFANLQPVLACTQSAMIGTWTQFIAENGIPDAGKKIIWSFTDGLLTSTTELTDDLTATGSYGPYFESENTYRVTFEPATCNFTGVSISSVERNFRNYSEPSSQVSINYIDEKTTIKFNASASNDSLVAISNDGKTIFQMSRER
jgi:hypothetical protein